MLVALGLCTAAAQASIESLYDNYVSSSGAARIEAQKKLVKLLADEQYIDPDYVNDKKQQEAVMCYGMAEYYSDANDYNKTKALAQKAPTSTTTASQATSTGCWASPSTARATLPRR